MHENNKVKKQLKGVLNPNFWPFSFEMRKIRYFKINFELGCKSSVTSETEDIWNSFSLSNLMTSSREP